MDNVSSKEDAILDVNETKAEKDENAIFQRYKHIRWLLVVVGTIVMFAISISYAWSIFNAPIIKEYPDWTAGQVSLTFTIFMISYALFGIVSGLLIRWQKGKVRLNFIISAIFLALSFFTTSQARNLLLLYLGFGVFGGIGVMFSYNAVITVVARWFQDFVGIATGTLLMGYGLGSFLIGKLYSALIGSGVDWRVIFIAFGVILAAIALIASFVLVPPPEGYKAPDVRKPKIDKHPIETMDCTPLQMIRRHSFPLMIGMGVCLMMASVGISGSARNLVQSVSPELELSAIATIVGLISVFNAAGRIFTGFLNDWGGLRFNIIISDTAVVFTTALVGVAVLVGNLAFLIVAFILFGFAAGMSAPDGAVIVLKFYGEKNYEMNLQIVMLTAALNSLGAMVMGIFYDYMGNYVVPVFVLSGIAFIGWLCAFFLRKP
ncbi:MAG: MFS transporter [Clostridia bacterium]|nr:MFS transporter [Clostridia bacterium]